MSGSLSKFELTRDIFIFLGAAGAQDATSISKGEAIAAAPAAIMLPFMNVRLLVIEVSG
jgi:hypothetical protein